jgi:hypothetical protein
MGRSQEMPCSFFEEEKKLYRECDCEGRDALKYWRSSYLLHLHESLAPILFFTVCMIARTVRKIDLFIFMPHHRRG